MSQREIEQVAVPVPAFLDVGFGAEREVQRRLSMEVARRAARIQSLGLQVGVSRNFWPLVEAPGLAGESNQRMPLVDPACQSTLEDGTAFWVGAWRDERLVATTAVRLRHVPTSLREEMESLRFFYDDPVRIPEGTWCRVDAPSARHISGLVMCSVAVWTAKAESGQGLAETVSQLAKLIGVGLWDPDFLIGFSMIGLLRKFAFHKYWHSTAELGFMLAAPLCTLPEPACLLSTTRRDFREQRLGLPGVTAVRTAGAATPWESSGVSSGVSSGAPTEAVAHPASEEWGARPSDSGHPV
ncbi:hypothetical protein F1188_09140 [Roseospira marina]|uniref:Uncharacterized protein n=1 Tax=Roseospira marina TaxID=140057 RepID=A0A5M6IBV7_9PROT|nr:hypothetical protein [Roseospira marina]KAA5605774.1 hypothetical protein F1188_09140 [Roseospira marina]MBB4313583.1 hypothetical protein [Roseospira marina]MBB5086745.1 hypothetical protein [Roseospira marina]